MAHAKQISLNFNQLLMDHSLLCTLEMFILIWCVHIIHIYIQITMDNYKKKFIMLAPNK